MNCVRLRRSSWGRVDLLHRDDGGADRVCIVRGGYRTCTPGEGRVAACCDAAALYGVAGLTKNLSQGQIKKRCVDAAADNLCDGSPVDLQSAQDVEWGTWDPAVSQFTPVSDPSGATAIRVTARRTNARGNAIPTVFARVLGRPSFDVTAVAIAARGHVISPTVQANGSPWLAGMPNGSTVPATGGNPTPATAAERLAQPDHLAADCRRVAPVFPKYKRQHELSRVRAPSAPTATPAGSFSRPPSTALTQPRRRLTPWSAFSSTIVPPTRRR